VCKNTIIFKYYYFILENMNRLPLLLTGLLALSKDANSLMIIPCGVSYDHYVRYLEPARTEEHTIQSGETLSQIALDFYGNASRFNEIAEYNDIWNPNRIEVGEVLTIPYEMRMVETFVGRAYSIEGNGSCTLQDPGFEYKGRKVHENIRPYCLRKLLNEGHLGENCSRELIRK
jgi:hypothetical protein